MQVTGSVSSSPRRWRDVLFRSVPSVPESCSGAEKPAVALGGDESDRFSRERDMSLTQKSNSRPFADERRGTGHATLPVSGVLRLETGSMDRGAWVTARVLGVVSMQRSQPALSSSWRTPRTRSAVTARPPVAVGARGTKLRRSGRR
jgi:hypothetical protein